MHQDPQKYAYPSSQVWVNWGYRYITNNQCPPTDFTIPPWSNHVLITPHHSVHRH
ncbi:hypothetical protein PAXRUDRAFT_144471 [Paxillus rubicundulus Ve08.2h10]|uniref:Uncharacterized protein n=1 Tax=Paxillus rubicundulus Ve08.2h10 TaxID=930991 RepID=A0A0D0E753_9AGAM|nr:hypothetical protein PAXRUDRAFT_144471 [Paxillus rubicundulus Ve08.2h10]